MVPLALYPEILLRPQTDSELAPAATMVVRGLVFQDSAAEAAFAAHRRASKHDGHLVARLSRLAKWGGLLAVGGTCPAKTPAAVLLASSLLAMILAAASTRVARRRVDGQLGQWARRRRTVDARLTTSRRTSLSITSWKLRPCLRAGWRTPWRRPST